MADLRRRLREPPRELFLPPLPEKVQVRAGDVAQLLTSAVTVAYIQLIGTTEWDLDMIRVMPGLFDDPLDDAGLAVLASGETAFLSPGDFAGMLDLPEASPGGTTRSPPRAPPGSRCENTRAGIPRPRTSCSGGRD